MISRDRATDLVHALVLVWAAANPLGPPTKVHDVRATHPTATIAPVARLDGVRGASDLARDPTGRLWAVTERAHTLVPVEGGPPVPIEGIPAGVDLEALAFVGPGRFLLGTERNEDRTTDILLEGVLEGGRARVVGQQTVDYAALGLQVQKNHGIEGLCAAGEHRILALEDAVVRDGRRLAVLVVDGRVVHLALTTRSGKIAAVSCGLGSGPSTQLVVWAIERHFGVARLLHFTLDASPAGPALVEPSLHADLAPLFEGRIPNLEGLAEHDGALFFVEDDDPSPPGTVTTVLRMALTSTRAGS